MAFTGEREVLSEPRLPVFTGRAWAFTDALAAADILPPSAHELRAADAARLLFAGLDADLAGALAANDVLIAGQDCGRGAGAAAAAHALAAAGFVAVVAASFAPGFDEALLLAGVPPLQVDAPAIFRTGQRLRVNLEQGTIANLSSGDRQPIRNLTAPVVERLRTLLAR